MPALVLLLLFAASAAQAHGVHTRVDLAEAAVVTLTYANGQAFAGKKYALTPAGQDGPVQAGETDALGRIVFLPGPTREWHLKVSSTDGHGVRRHIVIPPAATTTAPATAPATADDRARATAPAGPSTAPRWLPAVVGISLIFGLFGLFQLFVRRRR